jgi:hypothetical protein
MKKPISLIGYCLTQAQVAQADAIASGMLIYTSLVCMISEDFQTISVKERPYAVTLFDLWQTGALLTSLDISHVYKWYKDLIKLQKKYPYNKLHWGSFISTAVTLRINAFNVAHICIRRTIMDGRDLILENAELMEFILEITLPRTEQEWIVDFKRLVNFKKLARNQHEIPPDTTRFDEWYIGIMEIIYDAIEVYDILSSIETRNYCPPMKSYIDKNCDIFAEYISPHDCNIQHQSQINIHL